MELEIVTHTEASVKAELSAQHVDILSMLF